MPPPLIINGTQESAPAPFLSVNGGTQPAPKQQGMFGNVVNAVKGYAVDSYNQSKNFLNTLVTQNPITTATNVAKDVGSSFYQPFSEGSHKIGEGLTQAFSGAKLDPLNPAGIINLTSPNAIAGAAKVISGLAESVFSPVTGAFHIASQIPGVKQVADAVNLPFTLTGFAGSWTTGKAIDWIPDSILPQASKDIIKAPIQEVASLAAQTILGGKIMDKISEEIKQGKPVTPETATKIVEDSKAETQNHLAFTSEAITPPKLEVNTPIEMGPDSSTVKPNTGTLFDSEGFRPIMKDEIIPAGYTSKINVSTGETMTNAPIKDNPAQTTPQDISSDTKIVRVSKAASDINTNLVKSGFDAMKPETLATFDPITKANQIQRVSTLMDKNIEGAKDMAIGKKAVEPGVHPQVLFNAIEADALKNNDVKLLQKLAKSPLATQLSEAGQTLGAHGYNDNPNSPVRIIQDVQKAREIKSPMKVKKTIVDEINTEVKKNVSGRQSWEDFISQLTCNVE